MNGQEKTAQRLQPRCRGLCGNPLDGSRMPCLRGAISPSQSLAARSGHAVSRGRQRANDSNATAYGIARMEVSRHRDASNRRTDGRGLSLSHSHGRQAEPGSVVRIDVAILGSSRRVRPGRRGMFRALCLPSKNASLSPPDGLGACSIGPPDGLGRPPTSPPDGPMRGLFGYLSSPPDGPPLEVTIYACVAGAQSWN